MIVAKERSITIPRLPLSVMVQLVIVELELSQPIPEPLPVIVQLVMVGLEFLQLIPSP